MSKPLISDEEIEEALQFLDDIHVEQNEVSALDSAEKESMESGAIGLHRTNATTKLNSPDESGSSEEPQQLTRQEVVDTPDGEELEMQVHHSCFDFSQMEEMEELEEPESEHEVEEDRRSEDDFLVLDSDEDKENVPRMF